MVYGQKGERPRLTCLRPSPRRWVSRWIRAIEKVNLVNQGVQAQFTVLAKSMGLDADKAADWLRDHRKDSAMAAAAGPLHAS